MENTDNILSAQEPEAEVIAEPASPAANEPVAYEVIEEEPAEQVPVAEETPVQPAAAPKKERKFLKRALALLLVVALVAGGCGITAYCLDSYWYDVMVDAYDHLSSLYGQIDELDAQISGLNSQIDKLESQMNATNDGTGNSSSGSPNTSPEGLTPSQVYAKTIQGVVAIKANVTSSGYSGISAGSGFIISEDGYVVTNYHVVEGASSITVIDYKEKEHEAKLIGKDGNNDLAILKIEAAGLKPVSIGKSSELIVGDQVVAIGNALGELSFSLTAGYVSGLDRIISGDNSLINMIQTDVAINSGNSGGPLFNMKGEVIGITTAKYSGTTSSGASIEGIGFAIPIDDVAAKIQDIIDYGYVTGAYLGVGVREVDLSVSQAYGLPLGAYVVTVESGNCAYAAGVREKDIIVGLGEHRIASLNDLTKALQGFKAGDSTTITVWRGGQELTFDITLDEKPHD